MQTWLDIATIAGRKNLDGRLVVRSAAGLPFVLEEGMEVFLVPPQLDAPRQAEVVSVSSVDSSSGIVKLSGVDDALIADVLVGCHLLVDATKAPDIENIHDDGAADLYGWTVIDDTSGITATVTAHIMRSPQPLLEVVLPSEEGRTHLIPLAEELIDSIDESERTVRMHCPSGLFDI